MSEENKIIVISGFSGTGKGTVIKHFLGENDGYFFSVSATTRKPRVGEVHGVDYLFMENEEFEALIEKDALLEYAGYADNYYGTPSEPIYQCHARQETALLDVEVKGALNVRRKHPEALLVYIIPPSVDELYRRLSSRGTENKATILKRMRRAYDEVDFIPEYNSVLVNDEVERCSRALRDMIAQPELAAKYKEQNLALALSMKPELAALIEKLEAELR